MAIRVFPPFLVFVLCLLHVVPVDAGLAKSSMAVRVVVMERPEAGAAMAGFLQDGHRYDHASLLSRAASLPGVVSAEVAEMPLPERQPQFPSMMPDPAVVPPLRILSITY